MNAYYNGPGGTITPFTRAKAQDIIAQLQAIVAAFDLLPGPDVISGNRTSYAADTGGDSMVQIALPGITTYANGLFARVKIASTNTAAPTMSINGIASVPLVDRTGAALNPGDLQAGQLVDVTYIDGSFRLSTVLNVTAQTIRNAIGYTPANKAGDTFTGPVTFNNGITVTGSLNFNGSLSISSITASTGVFSTSLTCPKITVGNLSVTGSISVPASNVDVGGGTQHGVVSLAPGDATHTGYIAFTPSNGGPRQGYIGFATTNGQINYISDTGAGHSFTGPVMMTGQLGVSGASNFYNTLNVAGALSQAGNQVWHAGNFNPANYQTSLGFTPVQQGTGVGQLNNVIKIGWSGSRIKATVDTTDMGVLITDALLGNASAVVNGIAMRRNGSDLWGSDNFNPSNYAALTGANFTGSITATGSATFNAGAFVGGTLAVNDLSYGLSDTFNFQMRGTDRLGLLYIHNGDTNTNQVAMTVERTIGQVTFSTRPIFGSATPWDSDNLNPAAYQPALGFTPVQQSGGSGMLSNKVYIGWNGNKTLLQVDGSPQGAIVADRSGRTSVVITDGTAAPSGGLDGDFYFQYS